jgi:methylase of polypeptide subunit release factors
MSTLELFSPKWEDLWKGIDNQEPVGAVFTRPEIVDLILDLAGYVPSAGSLSTRTILEPSCGDGAFLDAILTRLIDSERHHFGSIDWEVPSLNSAIRAVDISAASLEKARILIVDRLSGAGCPDVRAIQLANTWAVHTDFLLKEWESQFSFVVGNPPYVRLEDLPKAVLDHYRRAFSAATDRADLYVAFIQRGLQLLAPEGVLAFICANRFAKNQYGASLRRLIARSYHVRHFVNLEHTQPFLQDVSAYPAIVVLDRLRGEPTHAASLDDLSAETLTAVRRDVVNPTPTGRLVSRFPKWYEDGSPWRTTSGAQHEFLAALEEGFPSLESSAPETRVGIGVATGADPVFVLHAKETNIEESRQIPLLMAQDVRLEELEWSGHYLINPFSARDDGSLINLAEFPGLAAYLESCAQRLKNRHVAKARPASWFRTIDRIWPKLQFVPKLILPDIQPGGLVGFDPGKYYPHHNLYWISSENWDLRALQALLRSTFVLLQVRAYSVQMRGGSLRYQAQTLRRLRIPPLATLSGECLRRLSSVATTTEQARIDEVAAEAYQLSVPV